ncbi:MAG: hypothetical protein JW774_09425 [Candidatus Aureabacteria bacterium]|nr:hypothetical protein [Candidatus Auribacterota bacterium]
MKNKYHVARICLFVGVCLVMNSSVFASECRIKGEEGKWFLEVDQKPFELKGAGCGMATGEDGCDYFALAEEMGANTVRTWGIDQGNKTYLDEAEKHHLKVDAGIWFPHCNKQRKQKVFSYINNTERLNSLEKETLDYVNKYKSHPAVIMWNLGNEVLFFTNEEEEKIAFCRFLENMVQKVKQADPDHPVLYTCAGSANMAYLKKYAPGLDMIGFNTYGGVEYLHEEWKRLEFSIPYLITEFGPTGPWDCPKDQFDKSIDQADYEKSFAYQLILEEAEQFKGSCLGLFAFHLGDTTQESLSWWNLTWGKHKRESFYTIQKFYTGRECKNKPPICTQVELNKYLVKPGERMTAMITARDPGKARLSYDIRVSTAYENILEYKPNTIIPLKTTPRANKVEFEAPRKPDTYKVHALVFDKTGNVAIRTVSFRVENKKRI